MPASGFEAVGFLGLWHLVVFGFLIPVAAWRNRRQRAATDLPPKKRYLAQVIIQQVMLTAIAVAVAGSLGIPVFGPYYPTLPAVAATAAILAVAIIGLRPQWRQQVARGDQRVRLIAPIDATDHALWAAVSLLAGIGEEIAFRGVLYWVLLQLTGSMAASVIIAAAMFGGSHLVQGWKAAAAATVFAAGFHVLVIATGSLYPAMVIHILYDLIAGVSYGRYVRALARSNSFMNSTSAATLDRGQAL